MERQELLAEIKAALAPAYGRRLHRVVLYGSEARGEGRPDSDIDVLVLLSGPIHLWDDVRAALLALYPLSLRWGRPISPKPVDVREYDAGTCPLFRQAEAEGVTA
ncbi:MAG TPA: nucleotidyltransferase domain-containing protein [Planctomycetota bacterium]|nr:nucleotidyltransferase domain-containing protein [Planctomycetota bacterium]